MQRALRHHGGSAPVLLLPIGIADDEFPDGKRSAFLASGCGLSISKSGSTIIGE